MKTDKQIAAAAAEFAARWKGRGPKPVINTDILLF